MSKLLKPRYEYYKGTSDIIDNELDSFVDDVAYRLNAQDFYKRQLLKEKQNQDEQIIDLQHRLDVAEKALELACFVYKDKQEMPNCFKKQAKSKLKEKNMEERERYKLIYNDEELGEAIIDTEEDLSDDIHGWNILCDLLNQQDKEIKKLTTELENYKLCKCVNCSNEYEYGLETSIKELEEENKQLNQSQKQLAIDELESINTILTDTIIEVTENETNIDKLCYLEEISASFGQKINNKIEELKGDV